MPAVRLGHQQREPGIPCGSLVIRRVGFDVDGVVVGIEIRCGRDTVDSAARASQVALPSARDQRNGDSVASCRVAEELEVSGGIVTVEEVELVLQLDERHRSAGGALTGRKDRQNRVEPALDLGEVPRFVLAHPQSRDEREPRGQPAAVPLGADVRPRPGDDQQPGIRAQIQEVGDVPVAVEIKVPGALLVCVPWHV